MSVILSIDSAGQGCSVCVWRDHIVLALQEETMARGQDARLIPMIQHVLKEASAGYSDLDRIAVTKGPGSFTGLRIGLATARGIGFAASKPVIGISRFAIHRAQYPDGDLLVVLDSRRAEMFTQKYPADGQTEEPCLLLIEDMDRNLPWAGDVKDCQPLKEPEGVTAARLAACAEIGHVDYLPRPLYLRQPDVTLPKC